MKKNKILRLASVMLMLCLITTCAISGTFAKYTTDGTATDSARIAIWGVEITLTSDKAMFADAYNSNTVKTSVTGEKLVAPGTSGTLLSGSITGKPEVKVGVSYTATLVLTGFDAYCPIVFTVGSETYGLTGIKDSNGVVVTNEYDTVANLVAAVKEAIEDNAGEYDANTDLSTKAFPTVKWEWAFDTQDDFADTILGNLMADLKVVKDQGDGSYKAPVAAADNKLNDYCLKLKFDLAIRVEQIDDAANVVTP